MRFSRAEDCKRVVVFIDFADGPAEEESKGVILLSRLRSERRVTEIIYERKFFTNDKLEIHVFWLGVLFPISNVRVIVQPTPVRRTEDPS